MVFSTYAYSNVGGRLNNEDYMIYQDGIWVVADGLGGHDCGEVASKTASQAVIAQLTGKEVDFSYETMEKIVTEANNAVLTAQKENEELASMRTTLVFAISNGTHLRYANVGDSRFYYFKRGHVYTQSEDHSVSALSARIGDIKYEDIRTDDDRNKLLKVLGNEEELKVKLPDDVIELESGDAFLLCSDGFWEHVYEAEMEFDLMKSSSPEEWLKHMLKRVILKTENRDNDNYTAIAVMIN